MPVQINEYAIQLTAKLIRGDVTNISNYTMKTEHQFQLIRSRDAREDQIKTARFYQISRKLHTFIENQKFVIIKWDIANI